MCDLFLTTRSHLNVLDLMGRNIISCSNLIHLPRNQWPRAIPHPTRHPSTAAAPFLRWSPVGDVPSQRFRELTPNLQVSTQCGGDSKLNRGVLNGGGDGARVGHGEWRPDGGWCTPARNRPPVTTPCAWLLPWAGSTWPGRALYTLTEGQVMPRPEIDSHCGDYSLPSLHGGTNIVTLSRQHQI